MSSAAASPSFEATPEIEDQRVVVSVVYVAVMFITILDATVVNVAIPTIRTDLAADGQPIEWVVTAYLLGLACTVPLAGWLAGRFGQKRLFLVSLTGFVVASVGCAAAGSLGLLVGARAMQGLAGGILVPLGMAMLFRAFPPAERARASRILAFPTAIAPAVGPILGGSTTDALGWRWVFLINVPIGVAALAIGATRLAPDGSSDRRSAGTRLDVAGAVLVSGGLAAALAALGEGARSGWSSTVKLTLLVGIAALSAFASRARRVASPVLDLGILRDRLFRTTTMVMSCSTGAFLGALFVLPLFLQGSRGMSPVESGLTTFPEALGVIVGSQLIGRWYAVAGPRLLMTVGMVGMAASMGVLAIVLSDAGDWELRLALFGIGLSFGCVLVPLQAATFARIAPPRMAQATSLFATSRQMASAIGVALLAAVMAASTTARPAHAAQLALVVAAGIALCGAVAAACVRDSDARATMVGTTAARPGTTRVEHVTESA